MAFLKMWLEIEKIPMEIGNRMIRAGFGQNKGRWFFRVDLWRSGYRITRSKSGGKT